mmetsp:Transcript_33529/g.94318  ORF Transcript_33529/g.94318 Transcript_33529/m.94318 type:complete len:205 (-) Transcript_33529:823-1437(-)
MWRPTDCPRWWGTRWSTTVWRGCTEIRPDRGVAELSAGPIPRRLGTPCTAVGSCRWLSPYWRYSIASSRPTSVYTKFRRNSFPTVVLRSELKTMCSGETAQRPSTTTPLGVPSRIAFLRRRTVTLFLTTATPLLFLQGVCIVGKMVGGLVRGLVGGLVRPAVRRRSNSYSPSYRPCGRTSQRRFGKSLSRKSQIPLFARWASRL